MTEKFITYGVGKDVYNIPESKVSEFEKDFPSATIKMHVDKDVYNIPIHKKDEFLKDFSNAVYAFDNSADNEEPKMESLAVEETAEVAPAVVEAPALPEANEEVPHFVEVLRDPYATKKEKRKAVRSARKEGEIPSMWETMAKGTASGAVGFAEGLFDRIMQGMSGFQYADPWTGKVYKAEDWYDAEMQNPDSAISKVSTTLGDAAEKLSREADPTGGHMGYKELMKGVNLRLLAHKGLAGTTESAIQTASAISWPLMFLNYLSNSGKAYKQQTLENPDIPQWKREAYSKLTSALEQVIERIEMPFGKAAGKAAGEALDGLTEEAAKKLLDKVSDETKKVMYQRFYDALKTGAKVVGKAGKSGLGESGEEVGTYFGNDAIGEVLDMLEGDEDYGIRAQWQQVLAENPDADLKDFLNKKADEASEAAIGGAISGTYMSGGAQAIKFAAKTIQGKNLESNMNRAYNTGSSAGPSEMYDVDALVNKAYDNAAAAFTDKDGNQSLSTEFIKTLSAEDAYRLSQKEDIPAEQQQALANLAIAKSMQEGQKKTFDDRLENDIKDKLSIIDKAAGVDKVISGINNGRPVYVQGKVEGVGDAVVKEDGSVVTWLGETGPIVVVDAITGEESIVNSSEIKYAESNGIDEYKSRIETMLRTNDAQNREMWRNTMSARAKQEDIQQYNGKKVLINVGDKQTEVDIQRIQPDGTVLVKGKKGDLGGQSVITMTAADFYDSIVRGEDGNALFAEDIAGRAEEAAEETAAPAANLNENPDYRGTEQTIRLNGRDVNAEVVSQDDTSDSVVFQYVDGEGRTRIGTSTVSDFGRYISEAGQQEVEPVEVEAGEEAVNEPIEVAVEEEQTETAPVEPEIEPQSINWDALFEQDKDAFFNELQNQYGERTERYIKAFISAAEGELAKLQKARPTDMSEIIANEDKIDALNAKIESLRQMIARLAEPVVEPEAVVEAEPEATVEVEPAAEEQTEAEEQPAEEQTEVVEETAEAIPVAPTPVDNPAKEAHKREKSLETQLNRYGIPREQKQDMAYNAGKAVGDFFATRDEYEAYTESAEAVDLGDFLEDFEMGVDASFANRQANAGNSVETSVTLEPESNTENNGGQTTAGGETTGNETETLEGHSDNSGSGRTDNGGNQAAGEGASQEAQGLDGDNRTEETVEEKYPARKGDVTNKQLRETFGFRAVNIYKQSTLNAIYDVFMEMAKMLGLSPKSMGHGGTLGFASVGSRVSENTDAQYGPGVDTINDRVKGVLYLRDRSLSGMLHEWWHSLDHMLNAWDDVWTRGWATSVGTTRFNGRKEVHAAILDILRAIKKSGHIARIDASNWYHKSYYKEKKEMTARAFEQYIMGKFAEKGIIIENVEIDNNKSQPTPEEMAVIAPAFDKFFEVIKEKEGKDPGTSVLFQIGQEVDEKIEENNTSEVARRLANEAIDMMFEQAGREVVFVTDEQAEQMRRLAGADAEFMISSDKPVFVSNAAVAVMGIKQEKATPAQWLAMIEKNGGLKAGEDKWMGLSDWLNESDKKTLTKQEVLDFINENMIIIDEQHYGNREKAFDDKYPNWRKAFSIQKSSSDEGIYTSVWNIPTAVSLYNQYHEDKIDVDEYGGITSEEYEKINQFADEIAVEYFGTEEVRQIHNTRLTYTTDGLTNKREIALTVPTIEPWGVEDITHFGDAGDGRAVVWIRFGETTDESGNKVLVIDEIQSKRHQEGREKGYSHWDETVKEVASKTGFTENHIKENPYDVANWMDQHANSEEGHALAQKLRDEFDKSYTGIPDAQFEKNWHELAMKRMLRYAAENGYDAVAWTKGEQQAERYGLSKIVESILAEGDWYDSGSTKQEEKVIRNIVITMKSGDNIYYAFNKDGVLINGEFEGKHLSELVGKELAEKLINAKPYERISGDGLKVGGEGMKGFYDKMLPAFMNKYGKKWGIKVADITLPNVEEAGRIMHSVPVTDAMKESVMEGQVMFMKRPNGKVFGWTDGKKIYLTKDGLNPNTKIHEYTHLWAQAMMQKNPKGWNSVKSLLKGTPIWDEVINDPNYSNIKDNEDAVASEALSRLSGSQNAAKMEQMAQQMIDEAKGTMRKAEARGLIQNVKDALNQFWSWVDKELFGIENFNSIDEITDRVLYDLMNQTDLGELSEWQVETQIVTDPKVIAELEASTKTKGFRNVVMNEDGTFSSPMAFWLQSTKDKAKSRVETAKFELGKWEEAEEHPELVDETGHVTLVKPNKKTVSPVAYDPYIHNRLEPVNLQFKEAWKRSDLVYVETEVADTDLESGYHADKAKLPVGVHSWSNGAVMLSRYDKPVRIMPWNEVADAWAARLNGNGVEFDVVPAEMRSLLVERGVEILPPHKNAGKECNDAYDAWAKEQKQKGLLFRKNIQISAEHYARVSQVLSDRYKGDDLYFEFVDIDDTIYICDYVNREAHIIGIKKSNTYENSRTDIRESAQRREDITKDSIDSLFNLYVDRRRGQGEHIESSRHGGASLGNDLLDESKLEEATTSRGNYELPFGADWTSVKTGYDGSRQPRVVFVDTRDADDGNLARTADAQNAAVDYLAGDSRNEVIENAVNEEAKKLGVKVTYKTREQMPKGHKYDKGYYNTTTGEVVICTENASSIADAIQTILHEAVAHKGLRKLMGDKFNEFINRVYESLDAETKAKVDARAAAEYDGNTAVAMEEYLASLAETTDFNKNSVWDKVKSIFTDIINTILGRNDIKIGDNELRYILRASYNNMVNPRGMESITGWAKDQMMRDELGVNKAMPEILSRTGIDPSDVAKETAAQTYDKVVNSNWQEFQRQFQDAYQPVRIAIDAIQQETGNIPIEDYENYLLIQNQSSSRSRVEIDTFSRKYYSPIISQINAIIDRILELREVDKKNEEQRAEAYKEVREYLIAKHGLERNKYYQSTKTRPMTAAEMKPLIAEAQAIYDDTVDAINDDNSLSDAERELKLREANDVLNAAVTEIKTREVPDMRDYSGLTSLFGLDSKQWEQAEEMAKKLVDEFEKMLGRTNDESGNMIAQSKDIDALWMKINAATDKTLRHSYESGLLSSQQYNDIKKMFKFYIPLRGFDEDTAEDVYSYARFEGNRFNPAVKKAEGRTSVADDPIAIIMNMAESEIAQGNKNRAKQALYNYLLNRAGVNQQNSLMQVEDVWYMIGVDENGNKTYQVAVPNHDAGETYEEFEARMAAAAAEGLAEKSKKGNLDIGYRFQKQTNRNAHYVYLKVNGVEKAIFINGDPKAADAINGTIKQRQQYGEEKMRALNRFLSSTFTNYSLEFTARNYARDMIYSHINIAVRESDPAYRKKFRQNWRHNNLGTMLNMLKAYRAGEYDNRALTEDEAAFVEFMENGGQTGYTVINSVEAHKRDLEVAIERMRKGIEKGGVKDSTVFKYTLGAVELLNEASELVTRFAAFKTSRDMGRSVVRSISDAKEITVNFNTKGAQDGTGFLGGVARYFGWSKFFFNASVQGVQNIAAMAKANKLKFCGVVGGVMGLGFLNPILSAALIELFGGDDEDEYWNIPEYERQNNLCILLPFTHGAYVKIPLPIGFREMYSIGDMVAAMLMDKKFKRDVMQVGTDMANKIASVVLPINPLESSVNGLDIWQTIANTALPSSAQWIIQNMTNTDWKGAPIQKEYTYNEDDPQWMKAFANNPQWMTALSKWCNENINLDGDYKGLDWSPEKLDNTLSNLFGGPYSLIKKFGRGIASIMNDIEEKEPTADIIKNAIAGTPLVGVAIGSGADRDDRFVSDAYFDMKEYYDTNIGYIKRRAEKFGYDLDDVFGREKGKHHPKMQEIYSNKNFDFMQEWYKGSKELDDLNDEVKKVKLKIESKENPSEQLFDKLARKQEKLDAARREFVDDMLELD